MSALIATYLSYGQFFNARHQFVAEIRMLRVRIHVIEDFTASDLGISFNWK